MANHQAAAPDGPDDGLDEPTHECRHCGAPIRDDSNQPPAGDRPHWVDVRDGAGFDNCPEQGIDGDHAPGRRLTSKEQA